jgi:flagellar basal-body rod protein FlgF
MNRGIYATATGMLTSQQWMDTIANNLANASTIGYKRDSLNFDEAMLRELAVNSQSIGSIGAGPIAPRTYTIFAQGSIQETGNPLDIAILGEKGLFGVQVNGQRMYTRDGSFQVNENGILVTKSGHPVLDVQGNTIQLPEGKIKVAEDGNITVNDEPVGQIGIFDAVRGNSTELGFTKVGGNLYIANLPVDLASVAVRSGALESSNVDPVESMVQMISLSRAFEMAQRSIQQQDELNQRLIQSAQEK